MYSWVGVVTKRTVRHAVDVNQSVNHANHALATYSVQLKPNGRAVDQGRTGQERAGKQSRAGQAGRGHRILYQQSGMGHRCCGHNSSEQV